MQDIQELYKMIGIQLKEQGTTAGTTAGTTGENEYIKGYIQGFKDRYEGLQPRYNDINENTNRWYDYSSMEMHRLDELKSKKLQDENQRLKDENQETIKTLHVERGEFQLALRKAEDDMMTLRARSRDIQYDSQRTNDEMIDIKKKCHKFSCQLQDEIHLLKEENKENQETIKRLQVERAELVKARDDMKDSLRKLQIISCQLQDENEEDQETIKRLQVERYEFEVALVKAQNVLMEWIREDKEEKMNLRSRTCDLQKEKCVLIIKNIENQEKLKGLQSSIIKTQLLQKENRALLKFIEGGKSVVDKL